MQVAMFSLKTIQTIYKLHEYATFHHFTIEFEIFRAYQFIRIYIYTCIEIQCHFQINVKMKLQCQRVHFLGAHNTIQLRHKHQCQRYMMYCTLANATNTLDRFSNTRQQ